MAQREITKTEYAQSLTNLVRSFAYLGQETTLPGGGVVRVHSTPHVCVIVAREANGRETILLKDKDKGRAYRCCQPPKGPPRWFSLASPCAR